MIGGVRSSQTAPSTAGAPGPAPTPGAGRKRRRRLLVKSFFSAALLYLVLRNVAIRDIVGSMLDANLLLLAACFGLNTVGWTLSVLRWQVLMRAQGVHAPAAYLLRGHLVGIFFNNLLPSTIGGDASRAYDSWRLGLSKTAAATVIGVDRFFGMAALTAFAAAAVLLPGGLATQLPIRSAWILGAAALIGGLGLLLLAPLRRGRQREGDRSTTPLSNRVAHYVDKLSAGLRPLRRRPGALALALTYSLLLQFNVIVYFYLIARSLHLAVPFGSFFVIIPLALFIMMVPISVNAIGVRENVFAYYFAAYGVMRPEAVAFAWIVYAFVLLQGVIGGVIYALRRGTARAAAVQTAATAAPPAMEPDRPATAVVRPG